MNERTERMSWMAALMKFLGKSNNRYKRYYNLELHMHCNHCLNGYLFSRHSLFFLFPFVISQTSLGHWNHSTQTHLLYQVFIWCPFLCLCASSLVRKLTHTRSRTEIGSHASTALTISCERSTQRIVISINFIALPDELQFIFRWIDVSMSNGRMATEEKKVTHTAAPIKVKK